MSEKNKSYGSDIFAILLAGCLSMFFTEVFAGSSLIWIIDPWSLLVTFPLYLAHFMFFLNLGFKTSKASIPQLYLFGVMFGLYESWITKVLWSGYPGSEGPVLGLVGGIAIIEFLVLVFFWHPIQAFIVPVLVYKILIYSENSELSIEQVILPSHLKYLSKDSILYKVLIFNIIVSSIFLSASSGPNIIIADLAILCSLGLIFLFLFLLKKRNSRKLSIYSLKLGQLGFSVVIFYLVALYLFMYFALAPYLIPDLIPHLIIISVYVIFALILKSSKPINELDISLQEKRENLIKSKDLYRLLGIYIILTSLFSFLPFVFHMIGYLIFTFAMVGLGIVLLIHFLKEI